MNSKSNSETRTVTTAGYPTEKELAAYNEAGHCIVGRFQGRIITAIYDRGHAWETYDDPTNMSTIRNDVELHFPYTELGNQPPKSGWFPSEEDDCTFKLAGVVAEKLFCEHIGVDSSEVTLGVKDVLETQAYAHKRHLHDPQAQQTMLRNSEAEARKILNHPICWHAVEQLATIIAEVLVKEPRMNGEHVQKIITQALTQGNN